MDRKDIINGLIQHFKKESIDLADDPTFFEDMVSLIQKDLDSFSKYVESVANMENALSCARFRMEGEEWRDYYSSLDKNRRYNHEACITACSRLNRFCKEANLPLFFEGDEKDRYQVQEFAEVLVCEQFESGANLLNINNLENLNEDNKNDLSL